MPVETVLVTFKQVGRSKAILDDWSVPIPPDEQRDDGSITLRDLIALIVRRQIEEFRRRQEDRSNLRFLSEDQINEGAACGKIDMGDHGDNESVDEDRAIDAALVSFEDGLFLVSVDGRQYTRLDSQVMLNDESRVAFVRMVMLSGEDPIARLIRMLRPSN